MGEAGIVKRIFRGSSYANVTATVALIVALGGTSYAAIKLPKNSVTSVQVKDRSLLKKDFKTGQLPGRQARARGTGGTGRWVGRGGRRGHRRGPVQPRGSRRGPRAGQRRTSRSSRSPCPPAAGS